MKYRMFRWWLSMAAVAALQACISTDRPSAEKPAPVASDVAAVATPPPEPAVEPPPKKAPPKKKVVRPRPKPPAQLANAQPQAGTVSPEQKEPEPALEPVNLVGLDEKQLTALLGAPSEQEEPTPGKIWRYRRANCTLDITLFPDVLTRTYRSLAYEVTSNDNTAEGKRACVPQQHVDAGAQ